MHAKYHSGHMIKATKLQKLLQYYVLHFFHVSETVHGLYKSHGRAYFEVLQMTRVS